MKEFRHPFRATALALLMLAGSATPAVLAAAAAEPPPTPKTEQAVTPSTQTPLPAGTNAAFSATYAAPATDGKTNAWPQWEDIADWKEFNPWRAVIFCIGLIIAFAVGRGLRWLTEFILKKRLAAKTDTNVDDAFFDALGRPIGVLATLGLSYATIAILAQQAGRHPLATISIGFKAAAAMTVAWCIFRMVDVVLIVMREMAQKAGSELDSLISSVISKCLKTVVVIVGILFIGKNFLNLDITALLAGAGVAGLAVAFAAQDTIANFFGSIMLVVDQPFKVGDVVKIGDIEGAVQHVGFRSTRIRTADGHTITVPNKKTADTPITNISRRQNTRQIFDIGLVYQTTPEQMEKAMLILKDIFTDYKGSNPEFPAHIGLFKLDNSELVIRVVAWHTTYGKDGKPTLPDYWEYFTWLNDSNLAILRRFNAAGLAFAYPTQTVYHAAMPDAPAQAVRP